jgi:CubicO group peptidase (beta-lactamase class C family)
MTAEVAGWIITRAAKKPYEQLASDLLWSKLGLQDDIYILLIRHVKYSAARA